MPEYSQPGKFEILKDPIMENLDEIANLAECWKRSCDQGLNPASTRAALIMLIKETAEIANKESAEFAEYIDNYKSPEESAVEFEKQFHNVDLLNEPGQFCGLSNS